MRAYRPLVLASLLIAPACRGVGPDAVAIGDGVPRAFNDRNLLSVVHAMLDSAGPVLDIKAWRSGDPARMLSEAAQARIFADDPSVIAVVGHAGSKGTLLAAPIYRAANVPLVVPTATAEELRRLGGPVFLLSPPNDEIGAFLVDQAVDSLGRGRLAVVNVADPYGEGIRGGVLDRLRARRLPLAGEAALAGGDCTADAAVVRTTVRALLARARPDAVILVLPQNLTLCAVRELVAADPSLVILTSDSFSPVGFRGISPAHRRHVHALLFWTPDQNAASAAFAARFRTMLGREPEPSQALTFDAYALVQAAVREGVRTRSAMERWLRALGTDAHPAFAGITGPIDFQRPRRTVLRLLPLRTLPP
ncbi:MAG: ABC transporter substrate-binding protein [Gemmatimonadaceae bacterium]|nr:ABC transporter substrate-binding protein [Gemmatimonadaceae bacterium]